MNRYSHMSDRTHKFIKRVDGRMERYTVLAETHCGHEELLEKAVDSRYRLTDFIADEFEKLVVENTVLKKKLGLPE